MSDKRARKKKERFLRQVDALPEKRKRVGAFSSFLEVEKQAQQQLHDDSSEKSSEEEGMVQH